MKATSIQRAIISVWDKTNLLPVARSLDQKGVQIYSTGGTYRFLTEAGIPVTKISDLTNFPEILDGRVKTLHPAVFAGLLARRGLATHRLDLETMALCPFDLVIVNLYPFQQTLNTTSDDEQIIEMIDVGGPSMIRAAAKNHLDVLVLSDPSQYDEFMTRFEQQDFDAAYRRSLAAAVFAKTAAYDAAIAGYLNQPDPTGLPNLIFQAFVKAETLRYGENPDQQAALYHPIADLTARPFRQLQGKEISYNNYVDCLAAFRIVDQLTPLACAIIKHTNPCGVGLGSSPCCAYLRAVQTDPVSYFGGIVAFNRPVDSETAYELNKSFLECIIAPEYETAALEILAKKKNVRLLIPVPEYLKFPTESRNYGRGLLAQTIQIETNPNLWQVISQKKPPQGITEILQMGWHIVHEVKSNAIVLTDHTGTIGIGAGQMARIDALKIALRKAEEAHLPVTGSFLFSDAFFPFRDSVDLAAQAGVAGLIQPGGSVRDQEVIEACDEHGLFMILTHQRVFKH